MAKSAATSLAMRAAATLSSWARSAMPYSASGTAKAPKVAVSVTSQPAAKYALVQAGDDVGAGDGQQLVAALEVVAAEVVGGEVEALHVGAEGAVVDDDALVDQVEEGGVHAVPEPTAAPIMGP